MEVIIGAGSVIFGMVITYFTFVRNRDKDIINNAKEDATISTQLQHISSGVNDIKVDMKTNEKQMDRMQEQIVRIDESTKSAHKRLDRVEGNKKC